MAVVNSSLDLGESDLVGLKIEISPDLTPRDAGIGNKIFTLIPSHVRTVRALKRHLAKSILKTPSPFYFFNGEFRIPDEEDVKIFSLLTEPCRILPVPQPKSVLSSSAGGHSPLTGSAKCTPQNSANGIGGAVRTKRVKFNEMISLSDLNELSTNSELTSPDDIDQVDNRLFHTGVPTLSKKRSYSISATSTTVDPSSSPLNSPKKRKADRPGQSPDSPNGDQINDDEVALLVRVQKRKRRRRHNKSKKQEKHLEIPQASGTNTEISEKTDNNVISEKMSRKVKSVVPMQINSDSDENSNGNNGESTAEGVVELRPKRKSKVLQGYDADESEIDRSQSQISSLHETSSIFKTPPNRPAEKEKLLKKGQDKIFLSPKPGVYPPRKVNNFSGSGQETLSSFSGSSGYGSPIATSTAIRRQDTPILPRVLKNPSRAFDLVRSSFNSRLEQNLEIQDEELENPESTESTCVTKDFAMLDQSSDKNLNGSVNGKVQETDADQLACRNDDFYKKLPIVASVDELRVGYVIAFKLIELDENYTPSLSSYKEATVIAKNGDVLTFEYQRNEIKERTGTYEIQDEEIESEPLDDILEKRFQDIINPKLVSATTDA